MTQYEMKKLSRKELLQLAAEESAQIRILQEHLEIAENELHKREININEAGSIAEASMKLSNVFEAAQEACRLYTDNIQRLSERQESICAEIEKETKEKAAAYEAEVISRCERLEKDTKEACEKLDMDTKAACEKLDMDTKAACEKLEKDTKTSCEKMVETAKAEAKAYWDELSQKLEDFYQAHAGLQAFLDKNAVMEDVAKAGKVEESA